MIPTVISRSKYALESLFPSLPLVVAPMFLVSGPDLVIASGVAGVVGSLPALNHRETAGFDEWIAQIRDRLNASPDANRNFGVNLIVHQSNPRLKEDLDVCVRHQVPIIITSLGAVREVVDAVHGYGGLVFHDVVNVKHARKAAEAGVDGLVLVCAGAGGHGGLSNPFAFLAEVRRFFPGLLGISGGITSGRDIAAVIAAGADFAYVGTRFIVASESVAPAAHKQMVRDAFMDDIVYTDAISGVHGNFLAESIRLAGLDPANLVRGGTIDFGKELRSDSKAWRDVWAAGHGVGSIEHIEPIADIVARMRTEYDGARDRLAGRNAPPAQSRTAVQASR
jgi:nitronate monooxygenase